MFDTHAFIRTLTATGMPEPQAEAIAQGLLHLPTTVLATKQDLLELRQELLALEHRLDARLIRIETEVAALQKWIWVILGGMLLLFIQRFFV